MWHFERREYCGVGPWEQGAADRWTAPSRSLNIKRLLVIQKPFFVCRAPNNRILYSPVVGERMEDLPCLQHSLSGILLRVNRWRHAILLLAVHGALIWTILLSRFTSPSPRLLTISPARLACIFSMRTAASLLPSSLVPHLATLSILNFSTKSFIPTLRSDLRACLFRLSAVRQTVHHAAWR